MVYFEKTAEAPASLAREKRKGENGSYREEDVISLLDKDFCGKCYICETKRPTGINIEHFIPHRNNIDLMFDWKNLFLSCPHCNNAKEMLTRKQDCTDGFLNCTVAEDRVDECISYRIEVDSRMISTVRIATAEESTESTRTRRIRNTVDLLNEVYNGTTPIKTLEARNIRTLLLDEMEKFQHLLKDYKTTSGKAHEETSEKLKEALRKNTPYTAFKRWKIKDCSIEF